ncbi:MAG: energy transducer TonB [Bacteroidota bacterium]
MSTKNSSLLFVFLFVFSTSFAQLPLSGSWEVIETKNQSSGRIDLGSVDFTGQQLHIIDDGWLFWESEKGLYLSPYQLQDSVLSYVGAVLTILEMPDSSSQVLVLQLTDDPANRDLILTLVPGQALDEQSQSYLAYREQTHLGSFLLQGVYQHYREDKEGYDYIRFLPDGRIIRTYRNDSDKWPLIQCNGAFHIPNTRKVELDQVNDAGEKVSGLVRVNDRFRKSETTYQSLDDGKRLLVSGWYLKRDGSQEEIGSMEFTFSPLDSSAHWIPEELPTQNSREYPFLQIPVQVKKNNSSKEIFQVVESMPRFYDEGCEAMRDDRKKKDCANKKMLAYVYSRIQYPPEAKKAGISGTLVVRFVVDQEGRVTNPVITRPLGGGCDEEVLRVVNTMAGDPPTWVSGKQRGMPVNVYFNLPLRFRL